MNPGCPTDKSGTRRRFASSRLTPSCVRVFASSAIPCRAQDRQQLDRGAASAHPGIMASVGRGTMKHVAVALAAALALTLQALLATWPSPQRRRRPPTTAPITPRTMAPMRFTMRSPAPTRPSRRRPPKTITSSAASSARSSERRSARRRSSSSCRRDGSRRLPLRRTGRLSCPSSAYRRDRLGREPRLS